MAEKKNGSGIGFAPNPNRLQMHPTTKWVLALLSSFFSAILAFMFFIHWEHETAPWHAVAGEKIHTLEIQVEAIRSQNRDDHKAIQSKLGEQSNSLTKIQTILEEIRKNGGGG